MWNRAQAPRCRPVHEVVNWSLVTWTCQNWYLDFSKLLHRFVKFVTLIWYGMVWNRGVGQCMRWSTGHKGSKLLSLCNHWPMVIPAFTLFIQIAHHHSLVINHEILLLKNRKSGWQDQKPSEVRIHCGSGAPEVHLFVKSKNQPEYLLPPLCHH